MKGLWIAVACLSLLFLAIWAGTGQTTDTPKPQRTVETSASQKLVEQAKGDAIGRSPSGATIETRSVTAGYFKGPSLESTEPTDKQAVDGYVIVLDAKVAGKTVARLTYHAVPPDKIVFIKQEQIQ